MAADPHQGLAEAEPFRRINDITLLATGGMSRIFRARQPALDRFVVIKKLKEELLGNEEVLERFRREARALASVLHQNIAHVYDFVEGHGEPYLVMEYIEGIDLSQVIEKVGNVPPRVAAAVLLGVAKGVDYLHARGLIHRDIKPGNIRLTTRGEVKLMDFGIVVVPDNESLTRPGMMVGSPCYLSPEQVLGDPITSKADLFLLGICLYEMLTGTRPFQDEGGETVFQRIRDTRYVPARKMQSSIPQALDQIVSRCLKRDPNKRFVSVKELILALERYLGSEVASHTEEIILHYLDSEALLDPSVPYTEIAPRRPPRLRDVLTPWQIALGGVVALFLIVAGFWAGSRSARPSAELKPPLLTVPSAPPSRGRK